jgi:hypothetical protein
LKELTNRQLDLAGIPDPEGDLHGWEHFAHTINGYEAAGSFEACADLANNNCATTLTELRCALFFVARSDRHGGMFDDCTPQVRELLKKIRARVEAGDLQ